jgi:hypothetical protein
MFGVVDEGMRTFAVNTRDTGHRRAICANAGMPDEAREILASSDDTFLLKFVLGELSAA